MSRRNPNRTYPHAKEIRPEEFNADDFWSHVDKGDGNGCWLWKGSVVPPWNYGKYRSYMASRIAFALSYYAPPRELEVCHTCDNPPCVRPDHLTLGTQAENNRDCRNKGRNSNGGGYFTLKDEVAILTLLVEGKSDEEISEALGLHPRWIARVRKTTPKECGGSGKKRDGYFFAGTPFGKR